MGFEIGDAAVEIGDGLAFRIGEFAMIERLSDARAGADDFAGDAHYGAVFGDRMDDDTACADAGVAADADVAEDFGASADDNVVAKRRVAFPGFLAGAAESDALIEEAIITDFGGFADDDAHSVIDEKTAADGGAGMNFDAGEPASGLGNQAGDERDAGPVEGICKAVEEDGVDAGVTEKNLGDAFGGGVFAEDGFDLFLKGSEHAATTIM